MGWHVPRGRQILARSVRRVRFPCGPLNFRKVAGYGLPGRFAKPCDFLSHVGSNPMPSAFAKRLDGETDIMSRFEREVPGSNPGRAALNSELAVSRLAGHVGSNPMPSALQNGSMVKRKSSPASNRKFRVRILVGLLPRSVTLAAGVIPRVLTLLERVCHGHASD